MSTPTIHLIGGEDGDTATLTACHFLAATLPLAARIVGQAEDPRWERVRKELPPYTVGTPERGIALWEGCDFAESHRHHSHLAAIYPFRTIDPEDPAHSDVVRRSMRNWAAFGAGAWTGWCLPWAAVLCARCGLSDASVAWLHWWKLVFTNSGRGTLHDADFGGVGGFHGGWNPSEPKPPDFAEVMQMDAGMGTLTAIMELLVQSRGDAIEVLPHRPIRWRDLRFDGIRTEGAFLLGATVTAGITTEVRVQCLAGGWLNLVHGLGQHFLVNGEHAEGSIYEVWTTIGESLVFSAIPSVDSN